MPKASKLPRPLIEKEKELEVAGELRQLLFENGSFLEKAIIQALELLGFQANSYHDSTSQFDVLFSCPEGRFLGEAEGKDSKPINIDKFRQLQSNLLEELEKAVEGSVMAKGVLFGNAFRLLPLAERGDYFTQKCLTAAQQTHVALVKTTDLFKVVKYLSEYKDSGYASDCRKAIFNSNGLVQFPIPPPLEVNQNPVNESA